MRYRIEPRIAAAPLILASFETHHFPAGGLGSVLWRMAAYLAAEYKGKVLVLAPFHRNSKLRELELEVRANLLVSFDGLEIPLKVLRHVEAYEISGKQIRVSWLFLAAEDLRLFTGKRNPYDFGDDPEDSKLLLKRNALFFGAAAAKFLSELVPHNRIQVLLHDWESLTIPMAAAKWGMKRHKYFAYLHNSYDMGLADEDMLKLGIAPQSFPGSTVLSRVLKKVQSPILTVSRQFALDLRNEPIQTHVFARHLQDVFQQSKIHGIDHGPFKEVQVSRDILEDLKNGHLQKLYKWKAKFKMRALRALVQHINSSEQPLWGDISKFQKVRESVWFFMSGRDDTRQKGFDVATAAAARILDAGEQGFQFLFFPRPGDEKIAGLRFLKDLADHHPEHVLVVPFDYLSAYNAAMAAATFGLMPSFFEPGGMISEMVANAIVPIGRATGGIVQCIVPWRESASFNRSVQERCDRWHLLAENPTGLLFHEQDAEDFANDWKALCMAAYSIGENPNRLEERLHYPLFREMVAELVTTLREAVRLYNQNPELYGRMILSGIANNENAISWQKTAKEILETIKQ